jgi:hypothetical protein
LAGERGVDFEELSVEGEAVVVGGWGLLRVLRRSNGNMGDVGGGADGAEIEGGGGFANSLIGFRVLG